MKTRTLVLVIAAATTAVIATRCGYDVVRMKYDDRAAEGVLRRGIQLIAEGHDAPDTAVALLPDSATHDTIALHRPYTLSFVDTYPYDASSAWTFFTRSAYVWSVCFEPCIVYEGEVRHRRDGIWTVWLTRTSATKCETRGGGA